MLWVNLAQIHFSLLSKSFLSSEKIFKLIEVGMLMQICLRSFQNYFFVFIHSEEI